MKWHFREVEITSVKRITAQALNPVAAVAQCLDNQWVPRPLLAELRDRGLTLDDIDAARTAYVRAEYLRALMTVPQLVINRAYLWNNTAVRKDWARRSSRKAFIELLDTGIVVPYLYTESAPDEPPKDMDLAAQEWISVCNDASDITCLRLSWNDDENATYCDALTQRFYEFALALPSRAAGNAIVQFIRHLGLTDKDAKQLDVLFKRLRNWAIEYFDTNEKTISRNLAYQEFVVQPGTKVTLGAVDRNKPYSAEIKQLLDLQYNTALPEFIDRLPLRPADTLHRAALREPVPPRAGQAFSRPDELERTLRTRLQFDAIADALTPIETPYLSDLTLESVLRVRKTNEWHSYADRLSALMAAREPELFETHGHNLVESYHAMLAKLGSTARRTHRFVARPEMILELAGVAIRVTGGRGRPSYRQIGDVSPGMGRATAIIKFAVINGEATSEDQTREPNLIVDTLRASVDSPAEFVASLLAGFDREGYRRIEPQLAPTRQRLGGVEKDMEPNLA